MTTAVEKILFMDVDGVLNSHSSSIALGPCHYYEDPELVKLDPVAVGLLREICKSCHDVKIYLHTSWSNERPKEWFERLFARYNCKPEILDKVHATDKRVDIIHQALQHYRPTTFLILDDDNQCEIFGKNFRKINPKNGMGWDDYEATLNYFGQRVPFLIY